MTIGQRTKTPMSFVRIDGNHVLCTAWNTTHDTDRGIGVANLTVPKTSLPFVNWNAPVSIIVGYVETGTGYVFTGTISGMQESYGENGPEYQIEAEGPLKAMTMPRKTSVRYMSLRTVRAIIANEAYNAGVLGFEADKVLYPDANEEIVLGGNPFVNNGYVPISRGAVPLDIVQHLARQFGYRVFDRPGLPPRLQRISGAPTNPSLVIQQGVNLFDIQRIRDNRSNANYWIIRGARWQDFNGVTTQAISQPAAVPSSGYYLGGYRLAEPGADDFLVNNRHTRAVRHVHEMNDSIPSDTVTIELEGNHAIMPGDVVQVRSSDVRITNAQNRWITSVSHNWSESGYWTTIDAWTGGGKVLSGGSDVVNLLVASGNYHLGNVTKSNYLKPVPDSTLVNMNFTVPEDYLAVYLTARTHGANSFWREIAGDEVGQRWPEHIEGRDSRIEILQQGEVVATVTLPMFYEALDDTRDYTDDANWYNVRLPVGGRLQPGAATVRIHAASVEQRGIKEDVTLYEQAGNTHMGLKPVANYLDPDPVAVQRDIAFTVPKQYKQMYLDARTHGANSMWKLVKNSDTDVWEPDHVKTSGSKVEIWQDGRNIASATLPYFYEPYQDDRPFSDDLNWHNVQLRLTADDIRLLQPGPATLRLITAETTQRGLNSGDPEVVLRDNYEIKDMRLWAVDDTEPDSVVYDNFEIKNLTITASGVPTTAVAS